MDTKINELSVILGTIEDTIKSKFQLKDDELLAHLEKLYESGMNLGGQINDKFTIPIKDGHGELNFSKIGLGVTLTGTLEIVSPNYGSWKISADIGGENITKDNVQSGEKISFSEKTNLFGKTKIKIVATWDQEKDTDLVVQMNVTY